MGQVFARVALLPGAQGPLDTGRDWAACLLSDGHSPCPTAPTARSLSGPTGQGEPQRVRRLAQRPPIAGEGAGAVVPLCPLHPGCPTALLSVMGTELHGEGPPFYNRVL